MLRYQTITLFVAVGTLILTALLYLTIPKGFFPTQDTGIIQGISQAAGSTSFTQMTQLQQELAKVLLADPAVESHFLVHRRGRHQHHAQQWPHPDQSQAAAERGLSATEVIRRLNPKLDQVAGIKLYMQPVQDLTVEDRVSRTQYQYTLEDPSPDELNSVVHDLLPKLQALPELADVVTDQQLDGIATTLTIDRATASRFGITPATIDNTLYDAFGQRQINTLYTQVNQYHVILEADPRFQRNPGNLHDLYIQASLGGTPAAVASSTAGSSSGAGSGGAAASGSALLTPTSSSQRRVAELQLVLGTESREQHHQLNGRQLDLGTVFGLDWQRQRPGIVGIGRSIGGIAKRQCVEFTYRGFGRQRRLE